VGGVPRPRSAARASRRVRRRGWRPGALEFGVVGEAGREQLAVHVPDGRRLQAGRQPARRPGTSPPRRPLPSRPHANASAVSGRNAGPRPGASTAPGPRRAAGCSATTRDRCHPGMPTVAERCRRPRPAASRRASAIVANARARSGTWTSTSRACTRANVPSFGGGPTATSCSRTSYPPPASPAFSHDGSMSVAPDEFHAPLCHSRTSSSWE
jgi:hypothetical protein